MSRFWSCHLVWLACIRLLLAQPSAAPLAAPAQEVGMPQITLGRALVQLYGPWKFKIGDSPLNPKTGSPLWAEPGFDDSDWKPST